MQIARNADLLIHDAQYLEEHYRGQLAGFPSTQGFGHSTVTMACEVAAAAEVERLVLFHHDPSYEDSMVAGMERTAKSLFADSVAAYEGLEFVLQSASTSVASLLPLSAKERAVQYAENG